MAYSYRWQYCDIDFLWHCLKQYSLLLEKIPSAILTEETTGTQMFVTGYLSDCIKRCDDGFDDYTMTALLPEGTASVTLQGNGWTIRRLSTRYHGKYAALLPEIAAYYFSIRNRLWEAAASHFSIMRTTECWKRSFSGTIFAGWAAKFPLSII